MMHDDCGLVGCHKSPIANADLDLDPTDPKLLASRLINVTATHGGANPDTGCVKGQKLIDTAESRHELATAQG